MKNALSICTVAALVLCPPGQGATLTALKAREIVQQADVLPSDYRQQVNATVSEDSVAVSVFRNPFAQTVDCKIDAVLLAKKLWDRDRTLKSVHVLFYELAPADTYWDVQVSSAVLIGFANGKISQDELLNKVELTVREHAPLKTDFGKLSYKNIIETLGIVKGPKELERANLLVRIDILQVQGENISELRKSYMHAEDLARRGMEKEMVAYLKDLGSAVDQQAKKIKVDPSEKLDTVFDSVGSVDSVK
jgi:hypothetical protein